MAEDLFETLLASTSTADLERQRDDYKAQILGLQSRIAVLNSLLSHRRAMDEPAASPTAEPTEALGRPSIGRAAITVMETQPVGKAWDADELYAELEKRTWLPGGKTPRNTMQATLSRLVKSGRLDRPFPGVYTLPAGHRRDASLLDQEGG